MAAPIGGQIFSEVLPYLEVEQGNKDEIEEKEEVATPDLIGKTIIEAEKILKDNNLILKINNEYDGLEKQNVIVLNQIPQPGITIYKGSYVYIDF